MSKFLISVGHTASGNIGCGAVGKLNESDCTREIAPLVVSKLQVLGHEAIKLQIDDSDAYDYVRRTQQANLIGGDYFVEIHLNAGIDYRGDGCEVLTTSGSKASDLAVKVSQAIANRTNITNRGHKTTSGLYVLNNTRMKAMLIEVCFVDGTNWNNFNAETIASAIVEGLTGEVVSNKNTSGEWIQDNTGWWYKHSDGSYTVKDFELIDGEWYYFDYKGYAITGWLHLTSNNNDYYFYDDCKMAHDCELWGTWRFDSNGVGTKIN